MNLHQKLIEIRKMVPSLSKDKKSFGYSYVSGSNVLEPIRNKMDELNILLVPNVYDYHWSINTKKRKDDSEAQTYCVDGRMVMTWIDADDPDDKLDVAWAFAGVQDDVSKAYGSGLTYAERYFLLKFFNIPTDVDDPDDAKNTKQPTTSPTPKPKTIVEPPPPQIDVELKFSELFDLMEKATDVTALDIIKSATKLVSKQLGKEKLETLISLYEERKKVLSA